MKGKTLAYMPLVLGVILLVAPHVFNLPLSIVYQTPIYTADAIILYDGPIPALQWDSETATYYRRLYFKVEFNPPSPETRYYFILESSGVSPPVFWTLFFIDPNTGGLLDGCGAWVSTVSEKFSGRELPGYYLIKWSFYREGIHYVALGLRCEETAEPSGTIKVMFKWTVPPPPTYEIEITRVSCGGLNSNIAVYGRVTPAVGGKQVVIEFTYPSGKVEKRTIITAADGTFLIDNPYDPIADEKGVYKIQAYIDSTASNPYLIEVKEKPAPGWVLGAPTSMLGIALIIAGLIMMKRK